MRCPRCNGNLNIRDNYNLRLGDYLCCLQCGFEIAVKNILWEDKLIYFKITEANGKLEQFKTKLKLGLAWVRMKDGEVFVGIGASHQNWLTETAKDYGAKMIAVTNEVISEKFREGAAKVEEYRAPCGKGPFFDKMLVAGHQTSCPECRKLKGLPEKAERKPRKPRASPSQVVAEVLPGMSLNVVSLLEKLKQERDHLLALAGQVDTAIAALEAYKKSEEAKKQALADVEKAKNSIRVVMQNLEA